MSLPAKRSQSLSSWMSRLSSQQELRIHTMRAKKSLGQYFLTHQDTLNLMVSQAIPDLPVLEVGPGRGALTRPLLEAGYQVVALEKDQRLIDPLRAHFKDYLSLGQLRIVEGDALKETPSTLGLKHYQVVANLPYYITGAYLRLLLQSDHQPQQVIVLLQEEVVDRIVAADGRSSILSVAIQVYAQVEKVGRVPRGYFTPQPQVDSAILRLTHISRDRLAGVDETQFFALLKQGFASKRKMLVNNLRGLRGPQGDTISDGLRREHPTRAIINRRVAYSGFGKLDPCMMIKSPPGMGG